MKIIKLDIITRSYSNRSPVDYHHREAGSHTDGLIDIAQAQLEFCEKEKTKEISALLKECKEYHDAVIKSLFEEIEAKFKLGNAKWIDGRNWLELKQKYGGK